MTETTTNIFDLYKTAHGDVTKARAIRLSEQPAIGTITPDLIKRLYESLACVGWSKKNGSNWVWRDHAGKPAKQNSSNEVLLERAIAALDMTKWTCQMSTSSGVQTVQLGARQVNLNSRRSIDLVRHIGQGRYAFIELKVGSDNPLYAAFEILGYALAYLHSRDNGWTGTKERDVFDAENIELTILGPNKWYTYGKRGTEKRFEYKLDWLADEIAASLNAFVTSELEGRPAFTMTFRKFPDDYPEQPLLTNRDKQAKEIHRLAEREWWKN